MGAFKEYWDELLVLGIGAILIRHISKGVTGEGISDQMAQTLFALIISGFFFGAGFVLSKTVKVEAEYLPKYTYLFALGSLVSAATNFIMPT